ncbi:MAG TPA: ABC transporter ATP-binding protein [Paludibacter sp.]|nr:ABC transporter ATP-binding protein [Paludibacter sp.]
MIKIKNLSFHYKKSAPLFSNFGLELENGRIVGLLGKNGAGKSTLLNLVSGLIQPQTGEISVNAFTPFDRKPAFLADVYMVQEEFSFPGVSIGTYVKAFSPLYPSFDHPKLRTILEEFELSTASNLNKLSHGQRKKFLIAFALATNCKMLVLDEPTNGLDIPSKSQFRKILVSSVTDEQLVIISTHQVKDIDTIIDKVVVIDNGKIIYQEDTEDISSKLSFDVVSSLSGLDNVLHAESCPSGHRIIIPANGISESAVDMELLFNAIINQKIKL